mmetsp:Transcript_12860/g.54036  ORF Transcript_12860/g.54036 Transcript_12860/m.54036 type:complete len:291 (+) Transcript_12860:913-1785(+)
MSYTTAACALVPASRALPSALNSTAHTPIWKPASVSRSVRRSTFSCTSVTLATDSTPPAAPTRARRTVGLIDEYARTSPSGVRSTSVTVHCTDRALTSFSTAAPPMLVPTPSPAPAPVASYRRMRLSWKPATATEPSREKRAIYARAGRSSRFPAAHVGRKRCARWRCAAGLNVPVRAPKPQPPGMLRGGGRAAAPTGGVAGEPGSAVRAGGAPASAPPTPVPLPVKSKPLSLPARARFGGGVDAGDGATSPPAPPVSAGASVGAARTCARVLPSRRASIAYALAITGGV